MSATALTFEVGFEGLGLATLCAEIDGARLGRLRLVVPGLSWKPVERRAVEALVEAVSDAAELGRLARPEEVASPWYRAILEGRGIAALTVAELAARERGA